MHMGYGPVFRSWVKLLYNQVSSRIGINIYYSGRVEQLGGVRQGCPLSPLLYFLSLEPLMAALRAAPSWTGIHLHGGRGMCAKVTAYADDMTLFLTSERGEVAGKILQGFCEASGAHVNVDKSSAMFAGQWVNRTAVPGGYSVCAEGLKILGIRLFRSNCAHENWEVRFKTAQAKIARWKLRGLSMWGRLEVVRADLLPILNYLTYIFQFHSGMGGSWRSWSSPFGRMALKWLLGHKCTVTLRKGEGVPCIPLKMDAIFSSFSARLATQVTVYKARFFAQFWLAFLLRSISSWKGTMPWSTNRPDYYQRVANLVASKPWCLEQSLILEHKLLYSRLRDELVEGAEKVVLPYRVDWAILQPTYQK